MAGATEELAADLIVKNQRLRAAVVTAQQEAERNARSGALEYDERSRWRRFAAQLQEALR